MSDRTPSAEVMAQALSSADYDAWQAEFLKYGFPYDSPTVL
jgi:hypothetical protein